MKITLRDLLEKKDSIAKLLGKEIAPLASFKLAKIGKAIDVELGNFDKIRNDLIVKYGEKNEKGVSSIRKDSEGFEKFIKEVEPILNEEVEFNFTQVKVKDLGDKFNIEPNVLSPLIDFIIVE